MGKPPYRSMTTKAQMKIRREKEAYKAEYKTWREFPFFMRVASFKIQQELEVDREVKSITYRVLHDLTT